MDTNARSIAKAISYRLLGSLATAGIVIFLTGNLKLSAGAGALDVVVKLLAYFLHERIWNYIPYGRKEEPPREGEHARAGIPTQSPSAPLAEASYGSYVSNSK